jgi:hypothetical protein
MEENVCLPTKINRIEDIIEVWELLPSIEAISYCIKDLYNKIDELSFDANYEQNNIMIEIFNTININPKRLNLNKHNIKVIYNDIREINFKIKDKLREKPLHLYSEDSNYNIKSYFERKQKEAEINANTMILNQLQKAVEEYLLKYKPQIKVMTKESKDRFDYILRISNQTSSLPIIQKYISDHPQVFNYYDENRKYFIEYMMEEFVKSFQNDNPSKTIHYQSLIMLCLENNNLTVDLKETYNIFRNNQFDLITRKIDDDQRKETEIFLINELDKTLYERLEYNRQRDRQIKNLKQKYALQETYSKVEIEELKNILEVNYSKYKDETNLDVITIDSYFTRKFEDAFYAEKNDKGYILKIYTSDIVPVVGINTNLFKRIFNKSDKYFLPNKILEDKLILKEGIVRPAQCYQINFDHHFKVEKIDFYKSQIMVKHNYNYEEYNQSLRQKNETSRLIFHIAKNIMQLKTKNGKVIPEGVNNKIAAQANSDAEANKVVIHILQYLNQYITRNVKLPFMLNKKTNLFDEQTKILKEMCPKEYKLLRSIQTLSDESNNLATYIYKTNNTNPNSLSASFTSPLRKANSFNNAMLIHLYSLGFSEQEIIDMIDLDENIRAINNTVGRQDAYEKEKEKIKAFRSN